MRKKWTDRLPDVFGRRRIADLEYQLECAQADNEELNANAEVVSADFEKDCWRSMRRLLDRCKFDWRDVGNDGVTADDAEEFIRETIDDLDARLKRATAPPETNSKPMAWWWEDKSGCLHLTLDREDVHQMAREMFCEAQPLYSHPAPPENRVDVEGEIARVVQSVNEWDDRTSPDDYPDHLLITSEELADILRNFAETLEGRNNAG